LIRGLVQGVGFRPFIFRLAEKHGLLGEVDNRSDGISVIVQGEPEVVDHFKDDIILKAPPASHIKSIEIKETPLSGYDSFKISESVSIENQITEVSPDIAVCDECLKDMENDPDRLDYPFVNCTNCGPRFTIIEDLPYDRPATTMRSFTMCKKCSSEYNDVSDRRFHAQPIACNNCGPVYLYRDSRKVIFSLKEMLEEVSGRISSGETVAIKGLGGYFLMCDALNDQAVTELRKRKQRDSKPFAVMFRDLSAVKNYCFVDKSEEKELLSWQRPIVLLKQKTELSYSVNSGLNTTGALLPYMPIHYLLFKNLKTPAVVLTSANLSDNPIITDDLIAKEKMPAVADSILSHNRQILNRADDSVIRIINGKPSFIRRSRGYVPRPVDLVYNVDGIIALGAEQKNSFCIGKGTQAIMSQYIGDLKNNPTYNFYKESAGRFSKLFRFEPKFAACDLHPDYLSSLYGERLEKKTGIPLFRIQHHHAHIASCMAEYGIGDYVTGICLDGTGYGTDGNIWGGEFLYAGLTQFERIAHFDYVPMPGGDKAVEEPWRMAFSYLFKYFGEDFDYQSVPLFRSVVRQKLSLVREMITSEINCPLSSGAGRLFDAVSALLGLCTVASFDSEAPMRLESAINCSTEEFYPYTIDGSICFSDTFYYIT
jgi:hydrogenase maturation protein HypF